MNYYDNLIKKFKTISNKNWIKSICNNYGGVGITFENELGKKSDSLFFPDFTVTFDGPIFPEIDRITQLYGHPDKDFPNKKAIYRRIV